MLEDRLEIKGIKKFYSKKQICISSVIATPLAATILICINYKTNNDPKNAKKSLIIGVVLTSLLFLFLYLIPQDLINPISNLTMPIIISGIIALIVDTYQKDILNNLTEECKHSSIKLFGLLMVINTVILSIIMLLLPDIDNENSNYIYPSHFERIYVNDSISSNFFDKFDSLSDSIVLTELENIIIPLWKENLSLTTEFNKQSDIDKPLEEYNKLLIKYSRIRLYDCNRLRALLNNTNDYSDKEKDQVLLALDSVLTSLDSLSYLVF